MNDDEFSAYLGRLDQHLEELDKLNSPQAVG